MDLSGTAAQNLLSPVTMFFLLGILAGRLKSDLSIPEALSKSLSLYLMIAIGIRGGVEFSHGGLGTSVLAATFTAVALSGSLPLVAYGLLRWTTRLDPTNAAAVAAHYGSVSVVTFAAAIEVLHLQGEPFEPYLVAMLAVMETPAILTGLALARRAIRRAEPEESRGIPSAVSILREVLLSGGVVLLLGSFGVGWLTGQRGMDDLGPLFDRPFKGVLCIFLLDVGLVAARRMSDLRAVGLGVAAFGLYMPLIGALAGLAAAWLLRLSVGGTTLLAVLGASASYIVVPAAMRVALPKSSPALYLTLALGITFPFNLIAGIPLYHAAARVVAATWVERAASIEDRWPAGAGLPARVASIPTAWSCQGDPP